MRSFFSIKKVLTFRMRQILFVNIFFYNFVSFALVILNYKVDYKVDVPFYTPACKDKES